MFTLLKTHLMIRQVNTLEFRINDLFVYSGPFVIQEGRGDIVFLFWSNKMSWINEQNLVWFKVILLPSLVWSSWPFLCSWISCPFFNYRTSFIIIPFISSYKWPEYRNVRMHYTTTVFCSTKMVNSVHKMGKLFKFLKFWYHY